MSSLIPLPQISRPSFGLQPKQGSRLGFQYSFIWPTGDNQALINGQQFQNQIGFLNPQTIYMYSENPNPGTDYFFWTLSSNVSDWFFTENIGVNDYAVSQYAPVDVPNGLLDLTLTIGFGSPTVGAQYNVWISFYDVEIDSITVHAT